MADGIRALKGELLWAPEPLELSMNFCGFDCTYCYANARKPDRRVDLPQIMGLLANFRNRDTREARLMQLGYPMIASNHVDVFAGTNARQFEPIWEVCVFQGVPIVWQTRGAHKPQRPILDRIIKETPRSIWYVSIPMWDDEIRKRIEPKAPPIPYRLELIQQLVEAGHSVVVGINPVCVDWLPDYEPLIDRVKELGAFGVWFSALYFGRTFGESLTADKVQRITPELIDRSGCNGSKIDHAHILAAVEYADAAGLSTYYAKSDRPSTMFNYWEEVYGKTMPMIQQLINQAHAWHAEEGDDYTPITRDEAVASMSVLPSGFNYGPFFHSDVKEFRKMMGLPQGAKLPHVNAEEFWSALWNSDYFSAKMGPLSCKVFAYASVKTGETITPTYDDTGHKVLVYNPKGFRYSYAHTPDLAE
jgi:DNA repair photolyase